jgi:hypothetical protein
VRRLTLRAQGAFGLLFFCLLAGCGGGGGDSEPVQAASVQPGWDIAWSTGTQPPSPHPDGWALDLPQDGSAHYVTMPSAPLAGKTRLVMRFRVELADGAKIVPTSDPASPSMLTLYIERNGLQWTQAYEAWRWYAAFSRLSPIVAGEHVITAPLDGPWSAAAVSTRAINPAAFDATLQDTGRIGFTLGGGTGAAHGVYATGPARIVVTSFTVE